MKSVLVASSAENRTMRPWSFAYSTVSKAVLIASSQVMWSLYFRWRSEVAMKTLTMSTSQARAASTSLGTDRDRTEILESRPRLETSRTALISASETTGKPASMISTPTSFSLMAISIFSSDLKTTPGICSPSLGVTSQTSISIFGVLAISRGAD